MPGYSHLTTPRPPSVSEHLIPWLFSESLFPTIRIVTKELARLKRDDNRMTKNRKICNSPCDNGYERYDSHGRNMDRPPMRKITSCVYMIGAHIFELHLFNSHFENKGPISRLFAEL